MKKVVFAIRKVKDFDNKISSLGYITDDGTLIQKHKRPNGEKSYRVFPDVEQRCFPILNKQNEYKGYVKLTHYCLERTGSLDFTE